MTIESHPTASVEKNTDLFDTPFLSEHYDLLLADYFKTKLLDVPVYWQLLKKCTQPNPILLDIGTGTGRIISGLIAEAKREKLDISNWTFLGVDISQHMLERAKTVTSIPPKSPTVQWIKGSAQELEKLPPLCNGAQKVGFILFSAGAFSHLYEKGQPEQFFSQVAKVIEPRTGMACISIAKSFMVTETGKEFALPQIDGPKQIESKIFPGVIYENRILSNETDGNILTEKRIIDVMRKDDGQEKVIERNHVSSMFRLWSREGFTKMATHFGFEITDLMEGTEETYFTLQLKQ
ncbi:uncharacterized protein N7473_009821 [Penicillium subrubescens]|uniref:Methyltransferase domain-containing protein n=1 Tax=Penicillium subrubescens TaxID=1316194 RepID=A0A1Q5TC89_9EURO|nr:uncharacterized protein N7473_009821 [Penicillium subrubescens]KAJ5882935.1 hypothetical protein N7473_009821 [Penicillium subrubescens]OKO97829.1 hypothetical protein PENSUB_9755 [Penicillium subrubescens]